MNSTMQARRPLGVAIITGQEFAAVESPADLSALADRLPASNCQHVPHSSALDLADRLINEPDCSHWLRVAIVSALRRDSVDAVSDAEILLSILSARLEEIQGGAA